SVVLKAPDSTRMATELLASTSSLKATFVPPLPVAGTPTCAYSALDVASNSTVVPNVLVAPLVVGTASTIRSLTVSSVAVPPVTEFHNAPLIDDAVNASTSAADSFGFATGPPNLAPGGALDLERSALVGVVGRRVTHAEPEHLLLHEIA